VFPTHFLGFSLQPQTAKTSKISKHLFSFAVFAVWLERTYSS